MVYGTPSTPHPKILEGFLKKKKNLEGYYSEQQRPEQLRAAVRSNIAHSTLPRSLFQRLVVFLSEKTEEIGLWPWRCSCLQS